MAGIVMDRGLRGICVYQGLERRSLGNLIYRKTRAHFNPMMSTLALRHLPNRRVVDWAHWTPTMCLRQASTERDLQVNYKSVSDAAHHD